MHKEPINQYCFQCDKKLCAICKTESHEDHQITPFSKLKFEGFQEMNSKKDFTEIMAAIDESEKSAEEIERTLKTQ